MNRDGAALWQGDYLARWRANAEAKRAKRPAPLVGIFPHEFLSLLDALEEARRERDAVAEDLRIANEVADELGGINRYRRAHPDQSDDHT